MAKRTDKDDDDERDETGDDADDAPPSSLLRRFPDRRPPTAAEIVALKRRFPRIVAVHKKLLWWNLEQYDIPPESRKNLYQEMWLRIWAMLLKVNVVGGVAMAPELPTAVLAAGGRLPFVPASAAPPPAATPAAPPATAQTVKLSAGLGAPRETLPLGADLGAHMRAALPFAEQAAAADDGGAAQMPVDTWAEICAALVLSPERTAKILATFGVKSEGAHQALVKGWSTRFAASPSLLALFNTLFVGHKDRLRARKK